MELLLFLIPFAIAWFSSIAVKIDGSDNAYHLLMISAIRKNGNSFIKEMPYFVSRPRHSYPQFLHWVFSYFSEGKVLKFAKYTGVLSHLFSGIATYMFVKWLFPYLVGEGLTISYSYFMIAVAMVYALSPLSYDLVNAKNVGFSARGLGLFLGQVLTYLTIVYLFNGNILYLLCASFFAVLIYMSSAFAMQYVLFFSLVVAILFLDFYLLIPSIGGLIIYFLFLPKVGLEYFKGQYTHKKLYSKYLGEIFILKTRHSVWRDLIFDFWKKLSLSLKGKESLVKTIQYITTNPIVNLLMGIPYLIILSMYLFGDVGFYTGILVKIVNIGLILFLATSFRLTRFLGEPERYVEFNLSIISVLTVVFFNDKFLILVILGVLCFTFIFLRIFLAKKLMGKARSAANKEDLQQIILFIEEASLHKNIKVVSNRSEYNKTLMSTKYQVFRHPLFEEYIGKFHFTDLHKNAYHYIENDQLLPVMKEFEVNFLVYLKEESNENFISKLRSDTRLSLVKEYDNLLFFEYKLDAA